MPTLERTITLRAPAATVFGYFTDPEKAVRWQSTLVEARFTPPGPMERGTRIDEVRTVLGRRVESAVEVTELDPPHRFTGRALGGPVRWTFAHTLTERDGQTTLRFRLDADLGVVGRLGEPFLVRALRKQLDGDLARLKTIVEDHRT